ncbi:MAG: 3-deoxy-D-manno-octulosonic acid transferase [Muribaculum sp.]|nr:3-deoxy-D-manno-octulosonic acid transferase [Muribaculum sp.]
MNPLYSIGIRIMSLGAKVASLRSPKVKKIIEGHKKVIPYLREHVDSRAGYVWIHAASLGEFEQGRPLIEMIKRRMPQKKILLTFFSPSGYEVRHAYPMADAVCYLPFDIKDRVCEFLDAVRPSMAIFVKYEFWGNYLQELCRRGVPTYIISAIFRPSQIFFKPWGGMFRSMLRCYTRIFVQDENSRLLLAGIGVDKVTVAGDTRFDRVTDIMRERKEIPQMEAFTADEKCVTIVAGSTWPPDEEYLVPFFNSHPDVKLVIAPHEVRADRIESIEKMLTRPCRRLSACTPEEATKVDCLIVDCYGMLSSAYRYGNIAYIGGGFGTGIHNVNEAAVYDIPVVFGPNYHKFKEARDLIGIGGAFTFSDSATFSEVMSPLVDDPEALQRAGKSAGNYIKDHLGATKRIFSDIFGQED